jgi:hypothetical protein
VNKPEIIYFYYHYEPHGSWWEQLKSIPTLKFEKVDIPKFIGNKEIKKTAHMADKLRMEKLLEKGGIYFDIDTISIKSYHHLLEHKTVLANENGTGICNAIMMTEPQSPFFKIWMERYERYFHPNGWNEASVGLPKRLSCEFPDLATVLDENVFFYPTCRRTHLIFEQPQDIPDTLITLHLWETFSNKYLSEIKGWEWADKNPQTMYGKIMFQLKKLLL